MAPNSSDMKENVHKHNTLMLDRQAQSIFYVACFYLCSKTDKFGETDTENTDSSFYVETALRRGRCGWILTLASHFLWVAVLHTKKKKKNESREEGGKKTRQQNEYVIAALSVIYINMQNKYFSLHMK